MENRLAMQIEAKRGRQLKPHHTLWKKMGMEPQGATASQIINASKATDMTKSRCRRWPALHVKQLFWTRPWCLWPYKFAFWHSELKNPVYSANEWYYTTPRPESLYQFLKFHNTPPPHTQSLKCFSLLCFCVTVPNIHRGNWFTRKRRQWNWLFPNCCQKRCVNKWRGAGIEENVFPSLICSIRSDRNVTFKWIVSFK